MMKEALELLNELNDDDIAWIFEVGLEQQIPPGTRIIDECTEPEHIYFILDGLIGISTASCGTENVGTLGGGELLGEMSFISQSPARATATALEESLLLAVPRHQLNQKLPDDPPFAARLYQALARIIAARMFLRVNNLEQQLAKDKDPKQKEKEPTSALWARLTTIIEEFKAAAGKGDKEAIANDDEVPEKTALEIQEAFHRFTLALNKEIGNAAPGEEHTKQSIGQRVQHEILPYMLLTQTGEGFYAKPRGYAGDYITIDRISQNKPQGVGRLGAILDQCFLNLSATKAVKNRRTVFANEIVKATKNQPNETTNVMCMACGPAGEVFDAYAQLQDKKKLKTTLIDVDYQALAFVADKAQKKQLKNQITPENGNLLYLALGRQKLDLKPQDLIYSIGLIDYFNDKFVLKLLKYAHSLLKPGGSVILGNFHPKNPNLAFMKYILEWNLIHRTEEDMNNLFTQSPFNRPCTEFLYEAEGINLFAKCVKD